MNGSKVWQNVPVIPTREMVRAAKDALAKDRLTGGEDAETMIDLLWDAMLAYAPKPKVIKDDGMDAIAAGCYPLSEAPQE